MTDILVPVRVVLKLFTMADALLAFWVEGNAMTDPAGSQFMESMAVVIERTAYVFAWIWSIV